MVFAVPHLLVTRSNAWLSFVFDALTVAFDNFTVPSRTIEPKQLRSFHCGGSLETSLLNPHRTATVFLSDHSDAERQERIMLKRP